MDNRSKNESKTKRRGEDGRVERKSEIRIPSTPTLIGEVKAFSEYKRKEVRMECFSTIYEKMRSILIGEESLLDKMETVDIRISVGFASAESEERQLHLNLFGGKQIKCEFITSEIIDKIFEDCGNKLFRRMFCKNEDDKTKFLLGILFIELSLYENGFAGFDTDAALAGNC